MNKRLRRRTPRTPAAPQPAANPVQEDLSLAPGAAPATATATLSLNEEAVKLGAQAEQLAERINSLETFIVTSPREATLQRLRTIDIVPPSDDDDDRRHRRPGGMPSTSSSAPFVWHSALSAAGGNDADRLTSSQRRRLRYSQLRHLVMFLLVLAAGAFLLLWIAHYFL